MKFINNNGLEIALEEGVASAKGVKPNGEEIVVDFKGEKADSVDYLFELDIFDLEKLAIKKQQEQKSIS